MFRVHMLVERPNHQQGHQQWCDAVPSGLRAEVVMAGTVSRSVPTLDPQMQERRPCQNTVWCCLHNLRNCAPSLPFINTPAPLSEHQLVLCPSHFGTLVLATGAGGGLLAAIDAASLLYSI